jgi:hypothetical protein
MCGNYQSSEKATGVHNLVRLQGQIKNLVGEEFWQRAEGVVVTDRNQGGESPVSF